MDPCPIDDISRYRPAMTSPCSGTCRRYFGEPTIGHLRLRVGISRLEF